MRENGYGALVLNLYTCDFDNNDYSEPSSNKLEEIYILEVIYALLFRVRLTSSIKQILKNIADVYLQCEVQIRIAVMLLHIFNLSLCFF